MTIAPPALYATRELSWALPGSSRAASAAQWIHIQVHAHRKVWAGKRVHWREGSLARGFHWQEGSCLQDKGPEFKPRDSHDEDKKCPLKVVF